MSFRYRIGFVSLLVVSWIGLNVAFSQKTESSVPTSAPVNPKVAQTIGMAGCAATGCHGRPEVRTNVLDADTWHESFAIWINRDPHTRAYAVLDGSLAKSIMKNLKAGDSKLSLDATRDARCLACHSNPSLALPEAMADEQLNLIRAEGVNCEACHGNAEQWQIAHTKTIPSAERTELLHSWQMNDLNDLSIQAQTCAGCHIGAPADPARGLPVRDMNHDMIAAGHPRLEFDFPAYRAKLAVHWQTKHRGSGPDPGRDLPLHSWLVGQIETERAYCNLSLDRMARANTDRSPYPEFADWNCTHCHHRLEPAEWRQQAVVEQVSGQEPQRKLGRPVWIGRSTFAPATPVPAFGQPIEQQKTAINERLKQLETLASQYRTEPNARVSDMIRASVTLSQFKNLNWDEAERAYLGLHSLGNVIAVSGGAISQPQSQSAMAVRKALWGSSDEPKRKEHAEKGYHRKPESRWIWEQNPNSRPSNVREAFDAWRQSVIRDLQLLP